MGDDARGKIQLLNSCREVNGETRNTALQAWKVRAKQGSDVLEGHRGHSETRLEWGGGPAVKWEMGDCRFLIGLIVGLTHNSLDNQRHDAVSFDEFHSMPTIHPTLTWSIITTHFGFLLVEAGDISAVDIRSLGSRSLLVAAIMVSPLLVR